MSHWHPSTDKLSPAAEVELGHYLRWCLDRGLGPVETARLARIFRIEPFAFLSNSSAQKYITQFASQASTTTDRTWPSRIPADFNPWLYRDARRPSAAESIPMARLYERHGPLGLREFIALCRRELPHIKEDSIRFWYHGELREQPADSEVEDAAWALLALKNGIKRAHEASPDEPSLGAPDHAAKRARGSNDGHGLDPSSPTLLIVIDTDDSEADDDDMAKVAVSTSAQPSSSHRSLATRVSEPHRD